MCKIVVKGIEGQRLGEEMGVNLESGRKVSGLIPVPSLEANHLPFLRAAFPQYSFPFVFQNQIHFLTS